MLNRMIELASLARGKKVFIWGTGALGNRVSRCLSIPFLAYVDNNPDKWFRRENEKSVIPPDRLRKEDPGQTLVVIASHKASEIASQLIEMGFLHRKSVIYASDLIFVDGTLSRICSGESVPPPATQRSSDEWIDSWKDGGDDLSDARGPRYLFRVPARPIQFPQSVTIDSKVHWYIKKSTAECTECRPYHVCAIPDARVFGEAGEIIAPNDILLPDLSADYFRPMSAREIMTRSTLPAPHYFNEAIAVASTPGGANYFHWLRDVMVRLFVYHDLDLPVDRYVINFQGAAFQNAFLRLLGIPVHKIIGSAPDLHLSARTVYRASPVENIPYLRHKLGRLMATCPDHVRSGPSSPKRRIFVSRAKSRYRHIENESSVSELLARRFGFETIYCEDFPVQEQAAIFNEAEIVVGSHGANLSNVLFCRPGCILVEFFHPEWVNICYWRLAHEGGLVYAYLLGEGDVPDQGVDRYHERPGVVFEGFAVDTTKLERLLEKVMARAGI
jgi:hypothetical protein